MAASATPGHALTSPPLTFNRPLNIALMNSVVASHTSSSALRLAERLEDCSLLASRKSPPDLCFAGSTSTWWRDSYPLWPHLWCGLFSLTRWTKCALSISRSAARCSNADPLSPSAGMVAHTAPARIVYHQVRDQQAQLRPQRQVQLVGSSARRHGLEDVDQRRQPVLHRRHTM